MTVTLYLTPLVEQTSDTASGRVGSDVQQAGLLEQGGVAVENLATENVDFQKAGRIQYGPTLSRKVAEELDSLSESSYTTLPLYDAVSGRLGRKRGYYEIARVEVTPPQESRDDVYEYDVQLTNAGTREDSRRIVRVADDPVAGLFATTTVSDSAITTPTAATDVQWFDAASGTEPATPSSGTPLQSEYGELNLYNTGDATAAEPALTYDLDFADDGPTDVRVYDSRDSVKFAATASGGEVNQWIHAYHTGYQFDGSAVIDTGRFRLVLGGDLNATTGWGTRLVEAGTTDTVASGTIEIDETLTVEDTGTFVVEDGGTHILSEDLRSDMAAARWDAGREIWDPVALDTTSAWSLAAWSLTRIGPARVTAQLTFSDGTDTARVDAVCERPTDGVVWLTPANASAPPQALLDLIEPTARQVDVRSAFAPSQGLIDRSALED